MPFDALRLRARQGFRAVPQRMAADGRRSTVGRRATLAPAIAALHLSHTHHEENQREQQPQRSNVRETHVFFLSRRLLK